MPSNSTPMVFFRSNNVLPNQKMKPVVVLGILKPNKINKRIHRDKNL